MWQIDPLENQLSEPMPRFCSSTIPPPFEVDFSPPMRSKSQLNISEWHRDLPYQDNPYILPFEKFAEDPGVFEIENSLPFHISKQKEDSTPSISNTSNTEFQMTNNTTFLQNHFEDNFVSEGLQRLPLKNIQSAEYFNQYDIKNGTSHLGEEFTRINAEYPPVVPVINQENVYCINGFGRKSPYSYKEKIKKEKHNRVERKRRDFISLQLSHLNYLLRSYMQGKANFRSNKGSVLNQAVIHINQLREAVSHSQRVHKEAMMARKLIPVILRYTQELWNRISFSNNFSPISSDKCKAYLAAWRAELEANLCECAAKSSRPLLNRSNVRRLKSEPTLSAAPHLGDSLYCGPPSIFPTREFEPTSLEDTSVGVCSEATLQMTTPRYMPSTKKDNIYTSNRQHYGLAKPSRHAYVDSGFPYPTGDIEDPFCTSKFTTLDELMHIKIEDLCQN